VYGSTSRNSCQALGNCGITALHCQSGSTCPWHVAIIEVECLDSLLHWCGLFVGQEPTSDLAIDVKNMRFDQRHCTRSSVQEPVLSMLKIRCWPAHVVSSLIHVNRESLGTSRASTTNRKHCLVTNTNGGQCHSSAVDCQPCWLRSATVFPSIHLLRHSRGGVTHASRLSGCQPSSLVANEVWGKGNRHLQFV